MKKMKIGIDLGGSHIAIGVIDHKGKILEKIEKRLKSAEKQNLKEIIKDYIIEQVKKFKMKYEIEEVGIGMPGWAEDGRMIESGNLQIKDWNLLEELKSLKLPIKIQNDAKCAGLAEQEYGCLKGYERSVFLTLGTGIGGATFVNHQLMTAGKRPGYEFGHMVIEKGRNQMSLWKKWMF